MSFSSLETLYVSNNVSYNESLRLSERRHALNVHELKKIAAQSVDRHETDIKSFHKLAEGGFNRVFEITMNDNTRVLARVPYPSTLPKGLAVASEAATLSLLRSHGIPVPKVLGYSATSENPVGAEYIIMEKLPGKPIGDAWYYLSEDERLKVVLGLVLLEAKLFAIELPAYGSIYYSADLPPEMSRIAVHRQDSGHPEISVGPDSALKWWSKERSLLPIDRGPHTSPTDSLVSIARKELAWLRSYGQPRLPFERAYREDTNYQKSMPEEHIETLRKYMRIAPYLVPDDTSLHRPTLRHPDLQPNNIFVSEKFDIVGIIDWQHSSVLPLFLAAGIPHHLQNYHDEESLRFVPPILPENLENMNERERAVSLEQFRRRQLHFYYLGFTKRFNKPHFHALAQEDTRLLKRKTFIHAGDPWEGNNIPLKADLIHITRFWGDFSKTRDGTVPPCPIFFDTAEAEECLRIEKSQEETDTQLDQIRGMLGIGLDGWTSHKEYENAVAQARYIKDAALGYLETEAEKEMFSRHWPFGDHDEDE